MKGRVMISFTEGHINIALCLRLLEVEKAVEAVV